MATSLTNEEVNNILTSAEQSCKNGQYNITIEHCERLLSNAVNLTNQQEYKALLLLGKACSEQNSWKEALTHLLKAYKMRNTDLHELYIPLGRAFEACNRKACAAACYKNANKHSKNNALLKYAQELLTSPIDPEDKAIAALFLEECDDPPLKRNMTIGEYLVDKKKEIDRVLYTPRKSAGNSYFHILREHCSYTPIIKGRGGGYYVSHAGKGCVVDPGYGFIRNFIDNGYGFGDIHAIIITHAHDDHMIDLHPVMSIFFKADLKYNIDLYLDKTTYAALSKHYILYNNKLNLKNIITPGIRNIEIFNNGKESLKIDVFDTKHKVPVVCPHENSDPLKTEMQNGIGLGFHFVFDNSDTQYVLLTSDTGWDQTIKEQYEEIAHKIDVSILHISSVLDGINFLNPNNDEKDYLYSQHLGLIGSIRFIQSIKPGYIVLSEKSAEVEGFWDKIAHLIAISCGLEPGKVIASKIGTKIILNGKKVFITG